MREKSSGQYGSRQINELFATVNRAHSEREAPLLNRAFIARHTQPVVQHLAALRGYRGYVEKARRLNATARLAQGSQRHLVSQARDAAASGRALVTLTLDVMRHLKHSGFMDSMLSAWANAITRMGAIPLGEVWTEVTSSNRLAAGLMPLGVERAVVAELAASLPKPEVNLVTVNQSLSFQNVRTGAFSSLRPARPAQTIGALLSANRFEAVSTSFASGNPVAADVVKDPTRNDPTGITGNSVDPFDLVLGVALRANAQLVRHARTLEDVGLPRHEGSEPSTIAIVIVLAALVLGAIAAAIGCQPNEDGTGEDVENPVLCGIGSLLLLLGFLMGINALCGQDPQDPKCAQMQVAFVTHANPGSSGVALPA